MIGMLYASTRDLLTVLFTNTVTKILVTFHLVVTLFAIPWFVATDGVVAHVAFGGVIVASLYVVAVTLVIAYRTQRRCERDLMLETIYRLETHTIDQ